MTRGLIGVTGATGVIGGETARILASAGIEQRLLVRDPARVPRLPGASVKAAAYGDDERVRASLRGVEVLLMVSAAESADRLAQHRAFIDAAAASGVQHIVYTSFLSAAPDAVFTLARDHWWTEQAIAASGMASTVLRDSFYADFLSGLAGADGVIRGPAGAGRVSAVARADVARSAAAVLQDPQEHVGATYTLTGPEALSMADIARVLTEVRGSAVTYEEESVEDAHRSRQPSGVPAWQVEAWVSTYTAIAAGALAEVTDDVQRVTGRAPLSLADFLRLS